jgi:hypothetical protein
MPGVHLTEPRRQIRLSFTNEIVAKILGREVIYCCRKNDFEERHFDTSVINHVVWNDPADLRRKLADRIKPTILPEA